MFEWLQGHIGVALQDESDFKKQDSKGVAALSIIAAFVRFGKEDVLGRVPDVHSTLAAPVRDVDALVQSSDSEIRDGTLNLQAAISQLQQLYSSRSVLKSPYVHAGKAVRSFIYSNCVHLHDTT